jgi:hypothetical protein
VHRNKIVIALAAIAVTVPALAACAQQQLGDQLPAGIGLPAGAPPRPAAQPPYPDVHDLPPARATSPMNEDERKKLERELTAMRQRHEKLQSPEARARQQNTGTASAAAGPKAAAAAKDKQQKPSAPPPQ